jgi:predicted SPOUT superfamily RNA methylase MTH1
MDQLVLPLTRVTLKLNNWDDPDAPFYEAEAVSKKVPRTEHGLYWGYDVRIAKNLPDMFNASKSFLGEEEYNIKLLCNHTKETYSLP